MKVRKVERFSYAVIILLIIFEKKVIEQIEKENTKRSLKTKILDLDKMFVN